MKFLLDVHVSFRLAQALLKRGHDVVHAGVTYPRHTDRQLLEVARKERPTLVTEDRDFSDLIFVDGLEPPLAILYLRCEPQDQSELVVPTLDIHIDRMIGHLAVIGRRSVRFRAFPLMRKNNG